MSSLQLAHALQQKSALMTSKRRALAVAAAVLIVGGGLAYSQLGVGRRRRHHELEPPISNRVHSEIEVVKGKENMPPLSSKRSRKRGGLKSVKVLAGILLSQLGRPGMTNFLQLAAIAVLRTALSNRLARVQGFLFRAAFLRRVPLFTRDAASCDGATLRHAHPLEEPIQVVDFGESGPVRCSQCKAYINHFMKFIDQGRRFTCNLCGFTNETPRDYHCNLGPDGHCRDTDQCPELSKGTMEFVASKEYLVRPPMPAVYYFLIDVSSTVVQTGVVVASCSAVNRALNDLLEGPRTMVGIATFDSTIHYYTLNKNLQQAAKLVVPDIQDVYTPLQLDLIVPPSEVREHLEQLLESIPSMFQNNRIPESAFGAAIKLPRVIENFEGARITPSVVAFAPKEE